MCLHSIKSKCIHISNPQCVWYYVCKQGLSMLFRISTKFHAYTDVDYLAFFSPVFLCPSLSSGEQGVCWYQYECACNGRKQTTYYALSFHIMLHSAVCDSVGHHNKQWMKNRCSSLSLDMQWCSQDKIIEEADREFTSSYCCMLSYYSMSVVSSTRNLRYEQTENMYIHVLGLGAGYILIIAF